nr:PREDICTED: uncharacterized protein LOC102271051 [Bos mutus]
MEQLRGGAGRRAGPMASGLGYHLCGNQQGRCAELQVHVTELTATAAEQRELIARLEQDLSTIQSIQRRPILGQPVSSGPTLSLTGTVTYNLQDKETEPRERNGLDWGDMAGWLIGPGSPSLLGLSGPSGRPLLPDHPTRFLPSVCLAPWMAVFTAKCGGAPLTSPSHLQGAAELGLEKIPEPIKEATALFYGPSAPASSLPEGQVDSLLSIISSQRERFRARNQELEAENRLAQHTIQALQTELDSLRADNIKLFEKIKFLQSYPGRGGGSDDTELRYSTQYEERLDPFSSFSKRDGPGMPGTPADADSPVRVCGRDPVIPRRRHSGGQAHRQRASLCQERQRKYLSLSPWDKATLSMPERWSSLTCLPFAPLAALGAAGSLQQDGPHHRLLLHAVSAPPGLPGALQAGMEREHGAGLCHLLRQEVRRPPAQVPRE